MARPETIIVIGQNCWGKASLAEHDAPIKEARRLARSNLPRVYEKPARFVAWLCEDPDAYVNEFGGINRKSRTQVIDLGEV